ncbi:MAG: hypothetical protein WDM86_11655 [Rhizomicrobium sp.]
MAPTFVMPGLDRTSLTETKPPSGSGPGSKKLSASLMAMGPSMRARAIICATVSAGPRVSCSSTTTSTASPKMRARSALQP